MAYTYTYIEHGLGGIYINPQSVTILAQGAPLIHTVCNGSAGAAMPTLWHNVHGDTVGLGSDAEDNV